VCELRSSVIELLFFSWEDGVLAVVTTRAGRGAERESEQNKNKREGEGRGRGQIFVLLANVF